MLVNTQEFRREALYYKKYGQYDHGIKGSYEYKDWVKVQRERSLYGYSVGGMWIPGYYYFYLNFCPIQIVEKGKGGSGNRKHDFPKFWDVDYMFFMSAHIAKYGTTIEKLDSLPIDINIQRREDNLRGGKHLLWLKPRGVGASFKGGSMVTRNYHIVPRQKNYVLADNKEFLTKDGIYSKFLEYTDWINSNADFFRAYQDFKADRNNMQFINSYEDEEGRGKGIMSELIGVTINNDKNKARGKRGILYLWEEAGSFGSLSDSWGVVRNSVEEDGIVYGQLIGFGTGGTEGADFESMSKMFYNPKAFNILAFNNIYDLGLQGNDCSLFTPADMRVQYIDAAGNSDREKGLKVTEEYYAEASESSDPTDLPKAKAEKPLTPQDAMLNTTNNKFATEDLVAWRNKLFSNAYYKNFYNPVELYEDHISGEIKSKLSTKHPPIVDFPHNPKADLHGTVVEYSKPYVDPTTKLIPDHLYYICHDPYADDDSADKTSLGAAYVIMNSNNIVPGDKGDRIVASWVGRPTTTDEYNEILFMLARRWNAMIGYENDRGDVLSFAKRKKLQQWLYPEFELGWDEKIANKNPSTYKYGMRIGGGKLNLKVLQGNTYISDWLTDVSGEREDGKQIKNLHKIYDIALLDELRNYKDGGNFDRVSALRIGMYFKRELIYRNEAPDRKKSSNKKSFKRFVNMDRYSSVIR